MKIRPSKILICLSLISVACFAQQEIIENIAGYHNNSKWQKLSAQETFDVFFDKNELKGDEKLLDLCSGDGKVSHYFAKKLDKGEVTGIDNSKKMIRFAKRHYANEHTTFKRMDVQSITFEQKFDVVTSFTCLHLVPDFDATIKGVEKVLTPNGKILFQFPYDHGLMYAIESVTNSAKWTPYFRNFDSPWFFYTPDFYRKAVLRAGLKPIRVEITQMHEEYDSDGEFKASIEHWLPHVKHLAEPLRGEFMDDLIDAYLSYMPLDEKGRVHYYVDRIEIEAIKPVSSGN